MEDLRKAKMDLPPPPQPNELPQKPFGVFQEQNFEAKVKYWSIDIIDIKLIECQWTFLGWHS